MNKNLETKMNFLPRMSRVIVAATFMAGSPGSVFAAAALAPTLAPKAGIAIPAAAAKAPAQGALSKVSLFFEKNRGQTDASVKFLTRAAGYNLYLTGTEAVMVLPPANAAKAAVVVRMKMTGANAKAAVQGQNVLPGHTSYMYGNNPAKWQIGVEQYAKVKFSSVYPGIDMVYYGKKGNVEHDFIVAPGANPGRILMGFEGAKSVRLDNMGNLILGVEGGEVTYKAPTLFQMIGGKRTSVQGRFMLVGDKHIRFIVGAYDKSKALVIDPELMYSTYLGGSVEDKINAIAVDGTRQAYVTGYSVSAPSGAGGFPAATATSPLAIGPNNGAKDVFVAKLSANGASLMWLAWMGGALDDVAKGIALDTSSPSTPKVFITGVTASPTFPVAGPAMQACAPNTGTLAFVVELTQPANIPAPVYSTCWGGVSGILTNSGNGIAVDSTGAAYITGTTFVNGPLFPIVGPAAPPYTTMGGASEGVFVMKVAPAGASVAYSMFLGTSNGITRGNTIAVDSLFQAWVGGMTTATTLPSVGGHFAAANVGTSDGFVSQVNAAGTATLYGTYINGNSDQEVTALKLNNGGAPGYHVFAAGWTVSPTDFPSTAYLLLPTVGPGSRPLVYQKDLVGADDPFIIRINPAAGGIQEMVFATHLGATGADRAYALALDANDNSYIAGWTLSSDWTLAADPVTPGANGINVTGATTSNTTSGGRDAFVAAINSAGQFQPFFSYLGATPGGQEATGIVIDDLHNIYVAGFTGSAIFPLVTGSLEDSSTAAKSINRTGTAGAFDGFVTKIAPVLLLGGGAVPPTCTLSVNPVNGYALGGTSVTITGTGFVIASTNAVTFGGVNAVSYEVNSSSTVIIAMVPRHPLGGALTLGQVALTVTNNQGSCSTAYSYVASPGTGASCGSDDYFFPSPATGSKGNFAYCMALPGTVRIRVYNTIGDLATKVEDPKGSGQQLSTINTARLASGVYLYLMEKDYGGGNVTRTGAKKFVVKH
ncbi:MAG: IPT/TIG domain-containing protein [Elusimicrobia bacterium]|nr:IPT/TIG domain-containing protein [Elusimicrobiota bacterium]